MVFPYIDHDLAGLMENKSITFNVSQIKLYSKQLLLGTAYLHRVRCFCLTLSLFLCW
jgi:serine/threonine-protein kinase BUR1